MIDDKFLLPGGTQRMLTVLIKILKSGRGQRDIDMAKVDDLFERILRSPTMPLPVVTLVCFTLTVQELGDLLREKRMDEVQAEHDFYALGGQHQVFSVQRAMSASAILQSARKYMPAHVYCMAEVRDGVGGDTLEVQYCTDIADRCQDVQSMATSLTQIEKMRRGRAYLMRMLSTEGYDYTDVDFTQMTEEQAIQMDRDHPMPTSTDRNAKFTEANRKAFLTQIQVRAHAHAKTLLILC